MTLSAGALSAQNTQQASAADGVPIQLVDTAGGHQRIESARKLRMLSQHIPAAACNLNAGVAAKDSLAKLEDAIAAYDQILAALKFGDARLGIVGAEDRVRTLNVIEEIHMFLDPMEAAVANNAPGIISDETIQILADQNMNLMSSSKLLVSEMSGQYRSALAPAKSDALAIDIASRQRMLAQKMSKEVCFVLSGVNATTSLEVLGNTMNTFEVSLDALRRGMESVGVQAAPNPEIAAGLDLVQAHWDAISGPINTVATGGTVDASTREMIVLGLNNTMADMNRVVSMYTDASSLSF